MGLKKKVSVLRLVCTTVSTLKMAYNYTNEVLITRSRTQKMQLPSSQSENRRGFPQSISLPKVKTKPLVVCKSKCLHSRLSCYIFFKLVSVAVFLAFCQHDSSRILFFVLCLNFNFIKDFNRLSIPILIQNVFIK